MNQGMEGFSAPLTFPQNTPALSLASTTVTASTTLTTSTGIGSYLLVAMTSANQSVTLPSAVGMSTGAPQYIMRNTGTVPFMVRDNTGILLAVVPVRGEIMVALSSNSTVAGTWAVGNLSEFQFLSTVNVGASSVIETGANINIWCQVIQLTLTTFLFVYNTTTPSLYAVVCTLSGTTIIPGTPLLILSGNAASGACYFAAAIVSPTQAIVLCQGASAQYWTSLLTITGTSIVLTTQSTLSTVGEGLANAFGLCILNSTQALVFLNEGIGASGSPVAIVTIPSLAVNTSYSLIPASTGGYYGAAIQPITSSTALIAYNAASNTETAIAVLSVSGSVISQGAAVTVSALIGNFIPPQIVQVTATTFLVAVGTSIYFATVTGTSVSVTLAGTSPSASPFTIVMLSATAGYIYTSTTAQAFSLSGGNITFGLQYTIPTSYTAGQFMSACLTGSNAQVLMLSGASTSAITVEPVK